MGKSDYVDHKIANKISYMLGFLVFETLPWFVHIQKYENTNMTLIWEELKKQQAIKVPTRLSTRLSTLPLLLTLAHKIIKANKIQICPYKCNFSSLNFVFIEKYF